jgi:hypothetical protein
MKAVTSVQLEPLQQCTRVWGSEEVHHPLACTSATPFSQQTCTTERNKQRKYREQLGIVSSYSILVVLSSLVPCLFSFRFRCIRSQRQTRKLKKLHPRLAVLDFYVAAGASGASPQLCKRDAWEFLEVPGLYFYKSHNVLPLICVEEIVRRVTVGRKQGNEKEHGSPVSRSWPLGEHEQRGGKLQPFGRFFYRVWSLRPVGNGAEIVRRRPMVQGTGRRWGMPAPGIDDQREVTGPWHRIWVEGMRQSAGMLAGGGAGRPGRRRVCGGGGRALGGRVAGEREETPGGRPTGDVGARGEAPADGRWKPEMRCRQGSAA